MRKWCLPQIARAAKIFEGSGLSMVTCHIGARGAVIARFSMRRPLHSFVDCGSSWPDRNADVRTVLTGILTRLMHIPPTPSYRPNI